MSTSPTPIEVEPRQTVGTRDSRRLRRNGKLPAVIYGHGEKNVSVTLPMKQTVEFLRKGTSLFDLQGPGGGGQVLVKDVQYNHLGTEILHVDLFRVDLNEEITSEVPLVLTGTPAGVEEAGVLTQMRDTIEITCKVSNLPDEITADVSGLGLGDALHIGDITLPQDVRLPDGDADFTVAMVAAPRKAEEIDETSANATGDEPEIITESSEPDSAEGNDGEQKPE
jgi:large subunit ribosomal protein L25